MHGGPGGGHGMGPQGGRPPMMGGFVDIEEIEKYNQKQVRYFAGDDLHIGLSLSHFHFTALEFLFSYTQDFVQLIV